MYYDSSEYGPSVEEYTDNVLLQTSMLCPSTQWVPCPTCTREQWNDNLDRIATTMVEAKDGSIASSTLYFVLETTCAPLRWQEGVNHLVVVVFLFLGLIALGRYQKRMELSADEDILSASDYTIQIDNPPQESVQTSPLPYNPKDPNVWKSFFEQFGHVVYVTIALNNSELCEALAKRRCLLQRAGYSYMYSSSADEDILKPIDSDQEYVQGSLSHSGHHHHHQQQHHQHFALPGPDSAIARSNPKLYQKIVKVTEECQRLVQKSYDISAVFVTFDTERAQRAALKALRVGQVYVASNDTSVLPPQHVFQNSLVLDVMECVEPSAVRWQDLDETFLVKCKERFVTLLLSLMLIAAGFALVQEAFYHSVNTAAIVITLLNIIVPHIFKAINKLESHQTEDSYQASLYAKICIFRWVNTAVVTLLIKPSTATLTNSKQGLITAIFTILKAELMIAPFVHVLDIGQNLRRHIVSRLVGRSKHSSMRNAPMVYKHFAGSRQNLGEKYTNLTKTLFITFLYSVIFPAGYFMAAAALSMTYVTDKFLLVRAWGPIPEMGNQVAQWSRRLFFPLCLVTLCLTSEFFWSAYPFDDVCDTDDVVSAGGAAAAGSIGNAAAYLGTHAVVPLSVFDGLVNKPMSDNIAQQQSFDEVTVSEGTPVRKFCDQDFLERLSALIHVFRNDDMQPEDWMSQDQILFTRIFGLSCIAVLIGFICWRIFLDFRPWMEEFLFGGYSTQERDSGECFCDQAKINAYVPSVVHKDFMYPLLACDVQEMDNQHIGWVDPLRSHSYYNLARDVDAIKSSIAGNNDTSSSSSASADESVLSIIGYWPSSTKKRT